MLIALFGALWAGLSLWTASPEKATSANRRLGAILVLLGCCFLAEAWWWHVPLAAQAEVKAFTASSSQLKLGMDCGELRPAVKQLQRSSSGMIAIDSKGGLLVKRTLWNQLSASQREGLSTVASQIAACTRTSAPSAFSIRDIDTGELLDGQ